MNDLRYLALSVFLTWAMLMTASLLRAKAWSPAGLMVAFGNRENVPDAGAVVGRADRAAKNMLEGLLLFACALTASRLSGATAVELSSGAALFFWARVVYALVYYAGVPFLRTAVWGVSMAGVVMVALPTFSR